MFKQIILLVLCAISFSSADQVFEEIDDVENETITKDSYDTGTEPQKEETVPKISLKEKWKGKTKMVAGTTVKWYRHGYNPQTGMNANYKIEKRYNICPALERCIPTLEPGFTGENLIASVTHNKAALKEAETYGIIATTYTACMLATPTFGVFALIAGMSGKSEGGFSTDGAFKPLLGLSVASLVGWWVASFLESSQLEAVADAYNKEVGIKVNYDHDSNGVKVLYESSF